MNKDLKKLLKVAKKTQMTAEERERQRRSFAYGSAKIENDAITRDTIELAARRLATGQRAGS